MKKISATINKRTGQITIKEEGACFESTKLAKALGIPDSEVKPDPMQQHQETNEEEQQTLGGS